MEHTLPRLTLRNWHRAATFAVPLLVLATVAAVAIPHLSATLRSENVWPTILSIPRWRLAIAIALTAVSYGLLTLQDALGLRAIGHRVPWRTAARGAFTSYALSHNLGLAPLTGGSARLHIYARKGVPAADVARLVVVAGTAFWAGIAAIAGLALLLIARPIIIAGPIVSSGIVLGSLWAHVAGAVMLTGVAAACAMALWFRDVPKSRLSSILSLERPALLPVMMGIAALDLACAATAFAVLVPGLGETGKVLTILVYALALLATLITHVPGGLGVFEGVMLVGLPLHGPSVLGGLIAYRGIYYLLPLIVAVLLNLAIELRPIAARVAPVVSVVRTLCLEAAPLLAATMTFSGGMVLLLSGALPSVRGRMHLLVELLPLPFVEASHLSASLVGTALLLVAPALAARLESGARTARLLFMLGAAFSLTKGLDVEEASVMLAMAAFLQFTQAAYYRRTAGAFSMHNRIWLAAAALAAAIAVACGFNAYHVVPYNSELWWEFALHGDAPRFLRAGFATGIVIAGVALRELLSRPPRGAGSPWLGAATFRRATEHHPRSDAALAWTGDKRFLIHPKHDAFVMFRQYRRTWVVMGDPVGNRARWPDLLWQLYRECDAAFSRLCIYQASEALLPLMIEMGLSPIKYGEEAMIDPATFTLDGPRMKSLRNSRARALREGLVLQIVPRAQVADWVDRLQVLSDEWLTVRRQSEKSFSLGPASAEYLGQFDIAIASSADAPEVPLAFANLWRSGNGEEMSVDLMRVANEAPPGTMDFLLTSLIAHALDEGCCRFNLGLAPMSGVRGGKLAPTWAKLVNLLFSAGKVGYNFRGVRHYKDKFAPDWQPRYIGLPAGWRAVPALLAAIAVIHRPARP